MTMEVSSDREAAAAASLHPPLLPAQLQTSGSDSISMGLTAILKAAQQSLKKMRDLSACFHATSLCCDQYPFADWTTATVPRFDDQQDTYCTWIKLPKLACVGFFFFFQSSISEQF